MTVNSSRMRYAAALGMAFVATYALARLVRRQGPWTRGQKQEAQLDDAVAASFPASDPLPF